MLDKLYMLYIRMYVYVVTFGGPTQIVYISRYI